MMIRLNVESGIQTLVSKQGFDKNGDIETFLRFYTENGLFRFEANGQTGDFGYTAPSVATWNMIRLEFNMAGTENAEL